MNLPPVLAPLPIYRTFSGFEMRVTLPVADPEGSELTCEVAGLPDGARFDPPSQTVQWTPAPQQIGAFWLPFTCVDDGQPPQAVGGALAVKVSPLDACAIPACDPLRGCTTALRSVDQPCCSASARPRIAEPAADCPGGRVMFVGRNTEGFGRLQHCDVLRMLVQFQTGAHVRFHVEARCLRTEEPVTVYARLEHAGRGVLFDVVAPRLVLQPRGDGFAERRSIAAAIEGSGPYFDLEDSEANLTVTITDADGTSVSDALRVLLSSTPQPDLPDADAPPPPRNGPGASSSARH